MAVMTFYVQYNMSSPIDMGDMVYSYNTGSEIALTDGMYNLVIKGSGLTYAPLDGVTGGQATSISLKSASTGASIFNLTGANIPMGTNTEDFGYSTYANGYADIWGTQAEQAFWLAGADTINGSGYADILNGYRGADRLNGNSGDDILTGGQGSDTLVGGSGTDCANYSDLPFYTGISNTTGSPILFTGTYTYTGTGNLGAGTVAISGLAEAVQTDKLSGMEVLRGSKSKDLINFSSSTGHQDGFQGLAGNDTIIGGDVLSGTSNNGDYVDFRYLTSASMRVKVDLTNVDSTTTYGQALTYFNSTTAGETDSLRKIHGVIGGAGNDTVIGSAANDWFRGGAGNDSFIGAGGSDMIDYRGDSSALNITLAANGATQVIVAGAHGTDTIGGVENIYGGNGADWLTGNNLANTLRGSSGADTLNGGAGNDTLYGDSGKDVFVFNTALSGNIDQIGSFSAVDDTIALENAVFAKLTATGVLTSGFFKVVGTTDATVNDDYILYNKATGALFYDATGGADGTANAVQFAVIGVNLTLTNADFVVI